MSVECKGQNCCIVGCKSYFHKINATTPISGFIKHKDCTDYCRELHDYAGKAYGIGSPPYRISSGKGSKADRAAVLQSLDIVAKTMHNDLVKAKRNKDYITDENAKRLKQAAKSLRSAGLTGYHLEQEINELAWFVGGDPAKISQLQHKLNQLSIPGKSGRLKEDGVYGPETRSAWNNFCNRLIDGAVPSLNWINPLQPGVMGIEHRISDASKPTGKIRDFFPMENLPDKYDYSIILQPKNGELKRAFMLDAPHYKNGKPIGYHMNMASNIENALPQFVKKYFYDHKEMTEEAFLKLKNFKNAKVLRVGGRILFVDGLALGIVGSFAGDAFAEWVVDVTCAEE